MFACGAPQGLLAATFMGTAIWKVLTPNPQLATMIPWAGEVPPGLLYSTALFDLLGGVGILLPSLTRITPSVAVFAALGRVVLQAAAAICRLGTAHRGSDLTAMKSNNEMRR